MVLRSGHHGNRHEGKKNCRHQSGIVGLLPCVRHFRRRHNCPINIRNVKLPGRPNCHRECRQHLNACLVQVHRQVVVSILEVRRLRALFSCQI